MLKIAEFTDSIGCIAAEVTALRCVTNFTANFGAYGLLTKMIADGLQSFDVGLFSSVLVISCDSFANGRLAVICKRYSFGRRLGFHSGL